MAISINWGTKVITVPQSFLTHLGGTNYEMDTNGFRIAVNDLLDDEAGIWALPIFSHNTEVTLGGIQYARTIEIINGYTVTFQDVGSPYAVSLTGSNNNILDVTNLNNVAVRSNNSAGLMGMREIQYASFQNGVWVDQVNGEAGTLFPYGTPLKPVNNFADAKTIADGRGFKRIYIVHSATLDATADFDEFEILGQSPNLTMLTILPEANTANCEIRECMVTGTLDGGTILRECMIGTLNYVNGLIHQCLLHASVITLGGGPGTMLRIMSCYSGTDMGTPVIDFNFTGTAFAARDHSGDLILRNNNQNNSNSLYMQAGHVVLEPTISNGKYTIRGSAKLTNGSTGTAIVDSANLLDLPEMVGAVWNYMIESGFSAESIMRILASVAAGNATGLEGSAPVFRDLANTKDRITATYAGGTRTVTARDGT